MKDPLDIFFRPWKMTKAFKKRNDIGIGPKKKVVKIYPKYVKNFEGEYIIPELKISGKWLAQNGFFPDHYIEITYGKDYLVIYPYVREVS